MNTGLALLAWPLMIAVTVLFWRASALMQVLIAIAFLGSAARLTHRVPLDLWNREEAFLSHAVLLATALLVRGVAFVALSYSDWLQCILREGIEAGWQVLAGFNSFLDYLREIVRRQVFGYESTS